MRQIELMDFTQFVSLSAPKLSPAGEGLAFIRHSASCENNGYDACLTVLLGQATVDVPGAAPGEYHWLDEAHILHPVASGAADGTAFAVTDLAAGESRTLFTAPLRASLVGELGGGRYLLRACVNVEERRRTAPLAGEALKAEQGVIAQEKETCCVLDEYPFWQNGVGVTNRDRTGLFIYDSGEDSLRRITGEWFDLAAAALAPDKKSVVFGGVAFTAVKPMLGGVWRYDIDSGATSTLLAEGAMEVRDLVFAGDTLVATACSLKGKTIAQMHDLYTIDTDTGEMRLLCARELSLGNAVGTDCRFAASPYIQADGDRLYFVATVEEAAHLMRCDLAGNLETVVGWEGTVESFSARGGRLVCVGMQHMRLQELYERQPDGSMLRISGYNEAYFGSHAVHRPQRVRFVNTEGNEIHGLVLRPHGAGEGEDKTYPAILNIHGGPRAAYGEIFYHEMQYWAAQGYYVMFCNPTGSLGRGQYFGDVCGKTGQIDYEDIMAFVDSVLAACPDIDPARLGVTGGSYGGFMTNWIIGHTGRFAAAASQRSTANNLSNEATTGNGLFFTHSCLKAGEQRTDELLWEQSPLKYIDRATTPTLFIHALEDYCCYHVEALQMYTALQRLGVETRCCLFKGENHELSRTGRPRGRARRLQEITAWMDRYLKGRDSRHYLAKEAREPC